MKKIFILLFVLVSYSSFSQVQATLKPGSLPSSVYITIRSLTTLSDVKFSTFQFSLAVPAAQTTGLGVTVTSLDPGLAYPPAPLTSTETIDATNFTVYVFSGDGGSGAATTYTAGVEYNYAEVFFTGAASSAINDLRIIQLPNGGINNQVNFYVASSGTDVTNQAAQFYSAVPANYSDDGNGYSGTSWARLSTSLIVLPVKFGDFTAARKNNDAILNWSVENESSVTNRYEIERSLNGVSFRQFQVVASGYTGNSSDHYSLMDYKINSLNSPVVYYRIKQVDLDGKFVYSDIKSVRLDVKNFDAFVYPNPAVNACSVNIDLTSDQKINIVLSDAAGKQIESGALNGIKGLNIYPLNMSKLSKGTYMIRVIGGSESKTLPVVKK